MPHDKEAYPYVVIGSGIVTSKSIARSLRLTGKAPYPVPVYQFAQTLEKAKEIADKVAITSETVLICEIVKVVR